MHRQFTSPPALFGAASLLALAAWRGNRRTSYVVRWDGRRTRLHVTAARGQFRVYGERTGRARSSRPGFSVQVDRRPTFNPSRSPMDRTYLAWAGLTYARGENAGTRYWVASVPFWFLATVAAGLTAVASWRHDRD